MCCSAFPCASYFVFMPCAVDVYQCKLCAGVGLLVSWAGPYRLHPLGFVQALGFPCMIPLVEALTTAAPRTEVGAFVLFQARATCVQQHAVAVPQQDACMCAGKCVLTDQCHCTTH